MFFKALGAVAMAVTESVIVCVVVGVGGVEVDEVIDDTDHIIT